MDNKFIQKAVGLKYEKANNDAPKVIASGKSETAKNIIKIAEQNNIPIKKDEDLVNMLSEIELNQEIPIELYKAVSEVFSFIYGLTNGETKNEKSD